MKKLSKKALRKLHAEHGPQANMMIKEMEKQHMMNKREYPMKFKKKGNQAGA